MDNLFWTCLFISIIITWIFIKLIVLLISIKYKLKINFKLNRNKLTNITISKYKLNTINDSFHLKYEINIDTVWISSCYINRNINHRFIIFLKNVKINYFENDDYKIANNYSNKVKNDKKIPYLLNLYFKYIGVLTIENLCFKFKNESQINFKSCNIELKKDKKVFKLILIESLINYKNKIEINFNKIICENTICNSSIELQTSEIEFDKIRLNISDFDDLKLLVLSNLNNKNNNSNKLIDSKSIIKIFKSILINKLVVNNRHELVGIELFNSNMDYLKLRLNNLNDNCFSVNKSFRLIDNFHVEIFKKSNPLLSYDLVTKCDHTNLYISIHFLKNLFYDFYLNLKNSNLNATKNDRINFNLELTYHNFYINLIDHNLNYYILGSKCFELNSNLNNSLKLNLNSFILFKSVNKLDKFSNNLLNQSIDFVSLFEQINRSKFENELNNKFEHVWGNLISCNSFMFKVKVQNLNKRFISINLDRLFIEHPSELIDSLLSLDLLNGQKLILNQNKRNYKNYFRLKLNEANLFSLYEKKYFIYFNLTDLNFKKDQLNPFYLSLKCLNCVQYRLDELYQLKPVNSSLKNKQYLNVLNHCYINYFKEDNNLNLIFLLKMISISKSNDLNEYLLTLNDVLCTWSLKIHFILYQVLFSYLIKLINLFKKKTISSNQDRTNSSIKFKILIESNILINFLFDYSQDSSKQDILTFNKTSSFHYFNSYFSFIETISIILNDVYLSYSPSEFNLNIEDISMFINVDDQSLTTNDYENNIYLPSPYKRKFFHSHKFSISCDHKNNQLETERKYLNTKVLRNKLILVNFDLIYINFIFSYDFAKLIDHVLNLRKCLYKIHNYVKTKNNLNDSSIESLSSDFSLNIKQLKLIIEDDPFEVKLSYNYALMSDEHLESIKRRQTLEQRRSIKENNLEIQAMEILKERESKIYLKRSNLIYNIQNGSDYKKKTNIRSELFCFVAENVELNAISDLDWHGRQKCYELLRNIDHFSPPPSRPQTDNLNQTLNDSEFNPVDHYLILWCRHINLNIQDFKFLFRDYTQPLLKMNKIKLFGKFIGSEYEPSFRSIRQVKMGISSDLSDLEHCVFTIDRNMSPFKFYYDLCSKMNSFIFAYGPCWEGCMAQLNLSLDKIIHPTRDPSKPMPWWDKSRLYLHGRLTCLTQQCQIIYHVSMDPYNRTEEMKLVWTQLFFDWKNMQMLFKGALDVYLNTESKYDDCCFLHLPNLELTVKIDWICKAQMFNKSSELVKFNQANGHNLVMPCAPDKIPIVVNSFEHDSYSQFRSENVNLTFSFVCSVDNSDSTNLPTCKFYASTSRFLEKIKNLLSAITRPTKRGKLFFNQKPRKPLLSRHFKYVNFNFDMPMINIIYWSSASEQYGVQLECKYFKFNSSLKLELIPFVDKLKRRPKPNWSVELMKFNLDQTQIYLMSPGSMLNSIIPIPSLFSTEKSQQSLNQFSNQTEQDPFMLEMNERSIKFLDAKPALRNFFMKIDSIYYEREKNSYHKDLNEKTVQTNAETSTNNLTNTSMTSLVPFQVTNVPKHNLLIKNLKAKWNNVNRDVVYILYEIYNKSKRLRHNLSTQALKQYDLFTDQLLQNHLLNQYKIQQEKKITRKSSISSTNINHFKTTSFNNSNFQSNSNLNKSEHFDSNKYFEDLLNKLDSEKNINSNIYCNEKTSNQSTSNFNDLIYSLNSINKLADILNENVFIELINSQVKLSLEDSCVNSANNNSTSNLNSKITASSRSQKKSTNIQTDNQENLKTSSNNDYLIISAARANIVQRVHKPVWKSQRYLEKTSWSGQLENMQYFATLNLKEPVKNEQSILNSCNNNNNNNNNKNDEYWLSDELIDPDQATSPNLIIDINSPIDLDKQSNNSSGTSYGDILKLSNDKNENLNSKKNEKRKGLGLILNKNNTNSKQDNSVQNEQAYYSRNQLQLIVSKCRCEFYMIGFDDKILTSNDYLNNLVNIQHQQSNTSLNFTNFYLSNQNLLSASSTSPLPSASKTNQYQIDLNSSFNEPIDCFTLIHHDINLCSNSNQYKMVMEIVNNLVLYFRPRRKQLIEKQKSIKFNLQLSMGNLDSLKQHIQLKQIETKQLLCNLRLLEKQLYHLRERIENEINDYNLKYSQSSTNNNHIYVIQELKLENKNMEKQYRDCKKMLNELSDELNISISCYKEIMIEKRAINLAQTPLFVQHVLGNTNDQKSNNTLLFLTSPLGQSKYSSFLSKNLNEKGELTIDLDQLAQESILNNEIPKRYEIWFKNTEWKLTDDDGRTGMAKFLMKNFLYTKVTNQQELDCVEHTLEIESCKLQDLNPTVNKKDPVKKNKFCEDVLSSLLQNSNNLTNLNNESLIEDDFNNFNQNSSSSSQSISNSFSNSSSETSLPLLDSNKTNYSVNITNSNSNMIRIYCKERPPVGIPVIEHLELNVSPLMINLTNRFFKMIIKYFFENQNQTVNSSSTLQRNLNQRNSFNHLITNDSEQKNNLINLNLQNTTNKMSSKLSPPSPSNNISHVSPNVSANVNNINTGNSNGVNINLPKVSSPSGFKNILKGHHKKPSQSSLKSMNNIILTSNNVILANSTNSINQITSSNNNQENSTNNSNTNSASNNNELQIEDIEIMKQRSANNNTFLCIKIPEIELLVSYKGSNVDKKNLKDLNNVSLLFPLFEVHDKTWTWLDLINALKSHVKKALLSQAIKHKLIRAPIQPVNKLINRNRRSSSQQQLTNSQIEEHEKMTMLKLFGTKFIEKNSQFTTQPALLAVNNKEHDNGETVMSKKFNKHSSTSSSSSNELKIQPGNENNKNSLGFKKHFLKFKKFDKQVEDSDLASNNNVKRKEKKKSQ